MFDLWFFFLAIVLIILACIVIIICINRFEIAVLIVAVSPWFSAAFSKEETAILANDDPTFASYIRIGLLMMMGIVGLVKFIKNKDFKLGSIPLHFILMGLFISWALISVIYSIDQRFTFIRAASFLATFFFLLGLYTWLLDSNKIDSVMNALSLIIIFYIVTNLLSIVLFPSKAWYYDTGRFRGLWGQPNALGSISMISYPVLLWKFQRSDLKHKLLIGGLTVCCALMHILSGSRGSLIATIIGITIWFIVQKKSMKLILFVVGLSILVSIVLEHSLSRFQRETNPDTITGLTGRTEFWEAALTLIGERPFLGYGYQVEGKVWSDPRFFRDEIVLWSGSARTSLHNGYISVAISLGVIALLLWIGLLLIPLLRCLKAPTSDYKAYALTIMSMALILNLIETILTGHGSMTAISYWIAWVVAGYLSQVDNTNIMYTQEQQLAVAEYNY
jgi:O-antigen ligase